MNRRVARNAEQKYAQFRDHVNRRQEALLEDFGHSAARIEQMAE